MRIQVHFEPHYQARIAALMRECGSQTYKELFNDALTLLQWAVCEAKAGRHIVTSDNQREVRLVMPILMAAASQTHI